MLCAPMQAHIVQVKRHALELYLVVCDGRAEALALLRDRLELGAEVACDIVGGLSDDEVAGRGLAASTIIQLR